MRRRELVETGAGLRREDDPDVGLVGAAQRHDSFRDLRADADTLGLAVTVGDLGQGRIQGSIHHGALRRCEANERTMCRRCNRRINGGCSRRLEIDSVGRALPVHRSHRIVDRAVDNGEDARLQDRVRRHRRGAERDDVPVRDRIRVRPPGGLRQQRHKRRSEQHTCNAGSCHDHPPKPERFPAGTIRPASSISPMHLSLHY